MRTTKFNVVSVEVRLRWERKFNLEPVSRQPRVGDGEFDPMVVLTGMLCLMDETPLSRRTVHFKLEFTPHFFLQARPNVLLYTKNSETIEY